jgi:hypothetical protein
MLTAKLPSGHPPEWARNPEIVTRLNAARTAAKLDHPASSRSTGRARQTFLFIMKFVKGRDPTG